MVYNEKSHLDMDDDWGYPYYLGNHQSHLPFPLSPFRVNVCVGSCSCLVLSGLQDRLGTASKGELLREVASWRKSHIRKWWQIKSGTITEHIWYLSLILLYLSFVELLNTSSVSAFGELTIEKKKMSWPSESLETCLENVSSWAWWLLGCAKKCL